MTNAEFRAAQDRLGLNNKALAAKLRCDQGSITKWRGETKVPPYIVALLECLLVNQARELAIPLTFDDLISLARKAESAGRPVDEYILSLVRADLAKSSSSANQNTSARSSRMTEADDQHATQHLNDDADDDDRAAAQADDQLRKRG